MVASTAAGRGPRSLPPQRRRRAGYTYATNAITTIWDAPATAGDCYRLRKMRVRLTGEYVLRRDGRGRRGVVSDSGIYALVRSGGPRCCWSRGAVALRTAPAAGVLPLRRRPSRPSPQRESRLGRPGDRSYINPPFSNGRAARQPAGSRLGATAAPTRATAVGLCHRPLFDLWPEPELHAPFAKVQDRTRHVLISALVKADTVAMGEAQDLSDNLSVDQVLCSDLRCHPDRV